MDQFREVYVQRYVVKETSHQCTWFEDARSRFISYIADQPILVYVHPSWSFI